MIQISINPPLPPSGEVILRDIPEQHHQRHMVASRSSNGSDYAMSPTGSGGSGVTTIRRQPPDIPGSGATTAGVTTLRRQASELNRLELDSFKSNWGTKTLSQPINNNNIYSTPPFHKATSSNSTQNFGEDNGQCHGSPWSEFEKSGKEDGRTYRDGTTFRTSTNLSDICKL